MIAANVNARMRGSMDKRAFQVPQRSGVTGRPQRPHSHGEGRSISISKLNETVTAPRVEIVLT